jgi:hypothetical protein
MGIRPRGIPRVRIAMYMVSRYVIAVLQWFDTAHYTSKPHRFVKQKNQPLPDREYLKD